uniref:Uncharacterized protein n=1 Tax=Clytia hemisphaerica TaxID=252671 RepID=A0A7M6DP51_9CNID
SRLNELRSICRINLPVLALTATVDLDITTFIKDSCNLSPTVAIISECVEGKNVALHKFKLETKTVCCLDWILHGLKTEGSLFPKVLIYCRTINAVSWLYEELLCSDVIKSSDVTRHVKAFISASFED